MDDFLFGFGICVSIALLLLTTAFVLLPTTKP